MPHPSWYICSFMLNTIHINGEMNSIFLCYVSIDSLLLMFISGKLNFMFSGVLIHMIVWHFTFTWNISCFQIWLILRKTATNDFVLLMFVRVKMVNTSCQEHGKERTGVYVCTYIYQPSKIQDTYIWCNKKKTNNIS